MFGLKYLDIRIYIHILRVSGLFFGEQFGLKYLDLRIYLYTIRVSGLF